MKAIINGKKYDTETAKFLVQRSNYGSFRDFNHVEETLYRKRTGEYFLLGKGGPNTIYAEWVDTNTRSGGSRIVPLTVEGAKEWAEAHASCDVYEKIFGEVEE